MERKILKLALAVASSLLLSFSAFADDGEASALPIEEVSHDIELVNDSTKEASDIAIDNLAEIQGGMLKSPSINPNVNFKYLGYNLIKGENDFNVSLLFEGNISTDISIRLYYSDSSQHYVSFEPPNYIISNIPYNSTLREIYIVGGSTLDIINMTITEDNIDNIINNNSDVNILSYLSNVTPIFTWLLTTIGTLIAFILGNPFLAVSLLLFMAGTVISFYIRIKNS